MKPILCRLRAYFAPGLPRPTKSSMTRHPAREEVYFFLSPPPAGAFAPAAGAAAPAAGAPAAGAPAAGSRSACRRSRSTCRRARCSRSRRLLLFGVTGRRHDGDQRQVLAQRPEAFRQRDLGKSQRVANLERADIRLDVLRDVVDRAFELDGVGDDV